MAELESTTVDDLLGCTEYEGPRKSLRQMEAAIVRGAKREASPPIVSSPGRIAAP